MTQNRPYPRQIRRHPRAVVGSAFLLLVILALSGCVVLNTPGTDIPAPVPAPEEVIPPNSVATSASIVTAEAIPGVVSTFYDEGMAFWVDGQQSGLADETGTILVTWEGDYPGRTDFSTNGRAYLQTAGGNLFGLIDTRGNTIKEPWLVAASGMGKTTAWYRDQPGGLWGLIDDQGNIVKEPFVYDRTKFDQYGLAWFQPSKGALWGLINEAGNVLHEPIAYGELTEDRTFKNEEEMFYLNFGDLGISSFRQGIETVDPELGGVVFVGGLYGLIDARGRVIAEPFAGQIHAISPDGTRIWYEDPYYTTDASWDDPGKLNPLYRKCGLATTTGQIIKGHDQEPYSYWAEVASFSDDNAIVFAPEPLSVDLDTLIITGNRAIMTGSGAVLNDKLYSDLIVGNSAGITWYQETPDGLYGILDIDTGEVIKKPFCATPGTNWDQFRGQFHNYNDISWYQLEPDGPWGLVNQLGEIVKEPFLELYAFREVKNEILGVSIYLVSTPKFSDHFGVASFRLEKDGLYGLVNERGEILLEPYSQYTFGFNEHGVATAVPADGVWTVVKLGF